MDGSAFPILIEEVSTEVLAPDSVQYPWQRVTARTTQPSHQLELSLAYDWAHRGRRHHWGDRQRWRLGDKLRNVLREIEQRTQTNHERQLAQQRKEEETRRRWHAAMDRARTAFVEAHRVTILREQVEAWHEASRIRAYCDALEQHLGPASTSNAAQAGPATQWIAWARASADRLDPLRLGSSIPEDPEISPADLRPYLHGWSPYEPKRA